MNNHAVTASDVMMSGFRWSYADKAYQQLNTLAIGEPLIVNTDTTGGPGVHWVTLVKLPGNKIYLYDPLGPDNERVTSDGIPINLRFDYIYPYKSQLQSTGHCGYFAIYVARLIRKLARLNRLTALTLTDTIQSEFGRSADWGDAKRIAASGIIDRIM